MANLMDFINFKVGSKTIALKILDILLTERYENNLTSLPNENDSFIGVKDYLETPTPIFDLGIMLNKQSTQVSNKQLSDLLITLENEHIAWMNALEQSILTDVPFNKEKDPDRCELGHWYRNFKTDNEDLSGILARFEAPHRALHQIADKLLLLAQQGQREKALAEFSEHKRNTFTLLLRLFESAREQIVLDYKPIIVFTTKDGINPYLGLLVDKVEDGISVDKSEIKSLSELTNVGFKLDTQTRNMMSGLIKREDKYSLIIDPAAIFRPEHLQTHQPEENEAYGLF